MKPLLTRIDEELAVCADPYRRAELLGERGCYLARLGRYQACEQTIEVLRSEFRINSNPTLLAWAMIVEGLRNYFASLSVAAIDRVWRSHESGRALGMEVLRDFSTSWLAHLEFERSNFAETARLIRRLDLLGSKGIDLVRVRAALVLGDVTLFSGDRASSQYWYSVAHRSAVAIGDQAALGALMYNRAAFSVAQMRANLASRSAPPDAELITFAAMELASARAFERGIGVDVLGHLVDLCEGRIQVLRGDFGAALAKFRMAQPIIERVELRSNRSHISGEIMYCEFRLGRHEQAIGQAVQLLNQDHAVLDVDDRVVLARQLVEVFSAIDERNLVEIANQFLRDSIEEYEVAISIIRAEFAQFYVSTIA